MFNLRDLLFTTNKSISKNILVLALPVVASNLSRVVMNMADVAMVGRLGAPALAATGMGSMLVWSFVSFCIGLRTATQTVASRRLGQKKYTECGVAMHNGHLLALVYGVPVSFAGYALAKYFIPFFINDTVPPRFVSIIFQLPLWVFSFLRLGLFFRDFIRA